ncbi:type VI secretion system membrane subunit TssM [Hyalangium sp.]|uniref:type VI secretion system membrane subunit TssM n=1 Tax=Hyalangium sp. TaxID=2028555 RepID=UPI002D269330|nr:type VI secretion system membrane subunit TssM [Hyalangium sp.]HYH98480.1 type VI secretion system membrane subunit TssM [Hyalangium sp.]
MLKYIFAALAAAILWAVVLVFQLPIWIAIVATTLIIVGLIALVAVRHIKAAKAAGDIEKALSAQADAHAANARPDLQEEVQQMQAEFAKAIAALKTSKLARGRGGKEALSVLPWYMIIGPPGSGKSTALRNSGIKFPYLSSRGGGVKGVGGTRNCEWWLTNEAVILDTAGRYTTEDDDRDEWFSFLDMLKRNRTKKPVNGLIIAVSVGDIIGIDEEESIQLAQRLRERLDEVMERLKMIVPVYLMFTKCDLLAGFVDVFGDLSKSDRGQIWGFTAPVMDKSEDLGAVFKERFDEMSEVVEQRSIQRMGEERHPETRERIYRFPQQFEGLRENIAAMVQTLFAENVYQDSPVMRGVYFNSGTQEGSPIDRVMNAMADAFGIRRSLESSNKPAVEARSYFLRDVFANVIFPDQDLAVQSTAEDRRQKQVQYAYAGGALVLALLILLFPTIAFFQNRSMIQDTRKLFQAQQSSQASTSTASIAVEDLRVLRDRLDELLKWEDEGPPTGMRFGMYRGSALFEPLRKFYGAAVRRTFVETVLAQDMKDLAAFAKKHEGEEAQPDEREYARYFSMLKLNLLLTGPRTEAEPPLGENERAWIVANLVSRWANRSGFAESADRQRILGEHLDLYVKLLAQEPSLAFNRNDKIINDTRTALGKLPFERLLLNQIIADVGRDADLKLSNILGGTASNIKSKGLVRGAFTRRGWDKVVRDRLESPLQNADLWVLSRTTKDSTDAEIERLIRALSSLYFEQYITEWQTFLGSIEVARPGSNAEVLAALEELTRGKPPPLARLFQALGYNTKLPNKSATEDLGDDLLKKLKDKINKGAPKDAKDGINAGIKFAANSAEDTGELVYTPPHVQAAFDSLVKFGVAPPPATPDSPPESVQLDLYQEQLVFIRDALRQFLENPSEGKALGSRLATARVQIQSLVNGQEDPNIRPLLGKLLMPPLDAATSLASREAGTAINQSWCSEIVDSFKRNLANRYPFNRNGHDAALADVGEFYRPGSGTMWGYFETSLKEDVRRAGDKFQFIRKLGGTSLQPVLLNYLKRSYDISTSLFSPNGAEPQMKFSISIRPSPQLSSITFSVDGKEVVYKNEPERWTQFIWPGDGKTSGAFIKVRSPRSSGPEELIREGEWGLFRLMEEGAAQIDKGSRVFTMTWKMPQTKSEVVIDFKPERTATPFFGTSPGPATAVLQPFRAAGVTPPRTIGRGAGCSE